MIAAAAAAVLMTNGQESMEPSEQGNDMATPADCLICA